MFWLNDSYALLWMCNWQLHDGSAEEQTVHNSDPEHNQRKSLASSKTKRKKKKKIKELTPSADVTNAPVSF